MRYTLPKPKYLNSRHRLQAWLNRQKIQALDAERLQLIAWIEETRPGWELVKERIESRLGELDG